MDISCVKFYLLGICLLFETKMSILLFCRRALVITVSGTRVDECLESAMMVFSIQSHRFLGMGSRLLCVCMTHN